MIKFGEIYIDIETKERVVVTASDNELIAYCKEGKISIPKIVSDIQFISQFTKEETNG